MEIGEAVFQERIGEWRRGQAKLVTLPRGWQSWLKHLRMLVPEYGCFHESEEWFLGELAWAYFRNLVFCSLSRRGKAVLGSVLVLDKRGIQAVSPYRTFTI